MQKNFRGGVEMDMLVTYSPSVPTVPLLKALLLCSSYACVGLIRGPASGRGSDFSTPAQFRIGGKVCQSQSMQIFTYYRVF